MGVFTLGPKWTMRNIKDFIFHFFFAIIYETVNFTGPGHQILKYATVCI